MKKRRDRGETSGPAAGRDPSSTGRMHEKGGRSRGARRLLLAVIALVVVAWGIWRIDDEQRRSAEAVGATAVVLPIGGERVFEDPDRPGWSYRLLIHEVIPPPWPLWLLAGVGHHARLTITDLENGRDVGTASTPAPALAFSIRDSEREWLWVRPEELVPEGVRVLVRVGRKR